MNKIISNIPTGALIMKQIKHILIPLDKSELSEKALETAFSIAKGVNAEVTLITVLTPLNEILKITDSNAAFIKEQSEIREKRNIEYLASIQEQYKNTAIKINTVIKTGEPAEKIIEYADNNSIDIIVMSTHGFSGVRQWVYGSVSAKILNGARHSVLLVRSFEE